MEICQFKLLDMRIFTIKKTTHSSPARYGDNIFYLKSSSVTKAQTFSFLSMFDNKKKL